MCLSKEKQVTILSSEGMVVDLLPYEGELKALKINHELLTIVSQVN